MRMKLLFAGAAALTVGLAAAAQAAVAPATSNLISDGQFNAPYAGGSFTTFGDGSSFGPWSVSGSVDLIGGYWQAPGSGQGSVDLDGSGQTGAISQDFYAPTAGQYTLSFDLSGNPDGGPTTKTMTVNVLPGSVADPSQGYSYMLSSSNSKTNMNYTPESFTFTLPTGETSLTFTSTDPTGNSYGPVIGNVDVSAVPEPASWAFLIAGIGGIGLMLRQARRRTGLAFAKAAVA